MSAVPSVRVREVSRAAAPIRRYRDRVLFAFRGLHGVDLLSAAVYPVKDKSLLILWVGRRSFSFWFGVERPSALNAGTWAW